jgi:phosphoribosyl-ATP pyrophosphohydrolase/phosphoribosyl-AMP cyclohydrolase
VIEQLDFAKSPLIPAIVQDAVTRQVLMLGFMNRAAVARTLETRKVTFFSRSRQTLWTKGETSGNTLELVGIYPDCDDDTLLVLATPAGPTCHRGTKSCFDEPAATDRTFLWQLEDTITRRLAAGGDSSYVATLAARGLPRIAQKVGEEGVETALAATTGSDTETVSESADLLFHLTLLLRAKDLSLDDVVAELKRRAKPDG